MADGVSGGTDLGLKDYIGQCRIKQDLAVRIAAAKARGDALDHILLCGPRGIGKQTLASVIAHEMGVRIGFETWRSIPIPGALASKLTSQRRGEILFIDDVDKLNHYVAESLCTAMDEFAWDVILGEGMAAKSIRLNLQRFTLIGTTARHGRMSADLRERFPIAYTFEPYAQADLEQFAQRSADALGVLLDPLARAALAHSGASTARQVEQLVKEARDYAEVHGEGGITLEVLRDALGLNPPPPVSDQKGDSVGMNLSEVPRQKLKEIIARFGYSMIDEPRRCEAMLLDLCGEYKREINLLILALNAGAVAELLTSSPTVPADVQLPRLARRLHHDHGLVEELARWAVDSWALALGMPITTTIGPAVADQHATQTTINTPPGPTPNRSAEVASERGLIQGFMDRIHNRSGGARSGQGPTLQGAGSSGSTGAAQAQVGRPIHGFIVGYCPSCKAEREIAGAKRVTLRNGRPAIEGSCPICGTRIFKIGDR